MNEKRDREKRIWELDLHRGIAVLAMIYNHFVVITRIMKGNLFPRPDWVDTFFSHGGDFFFFISGTAASLGGEGEDTVRRSLRRGLTVFGLGTILAVFSCVLIDRGILSERFRIQWGTLQLIGFCKILYIPLRKKPWWVLGLTGLAFIGIGFFISDYRFDNLLLLPLGFEPASYARLDYQPIFPRGGWFFLGAAAGKVLYKKGDSHWEAGEHILGPVFPAIEWVGRNSLWIYMLHFPVLYFLIQLLFSGYRYFGM